MGLAPPEGQESVLPTKEAEGNYRVHWTWPEPRFADQCLLAICPDEPGEDDDPLEFSVHCRLPIDRESWESGGGGQLVRAERDWVGGYVVVWAVVDLGLRTFYSPPLMLGRLEARSRWSWKGWRVFSSRRRETTGDES